MLASGTTFNCNFNIGDLLTISGELYNLNKEKGTFAVLNTIEVNEPLTPRLAARFEELNAKLLTIIGDTNIE